MGHISKIIDASIKMMYVGVLFQAIDIIWWDLANLLFEASYPNY